MAKLHFDGVDKYIDQLYKLRDDAPAMVDEAINLGAGLVADQVRSGLNSIPTDDRGYVPPGERRRGLRKVQLNGLQDSLGVAPIRDDGSFRNRKIGFDGYNKLISKRWPKGQPNNMVARSIESGTSFLTKTGFMSKAIRAAKAPCETAMRVFIESRLDSNVTKE